MPTETNAPRDENGRPAPSGGASGAASSGAPVPGASASGTATPTWWESITPAYMPAGAWSPGSPSSLRLTAPASSGWMPPASSFHSLAHGSSLPTAGAEPGDAMKAAAVAAATVAGDAIEAAQATSDVTLASAESTARSVAHGATGSVRDAAHDAAESTARSVTQGVGPDVRPADGGVFPAQSGSFSSTGGSGAIRPYDAEAIRSTVTTTVTGAVADATSPYRDAVPTAHLSAAREALAGVTDPRRAASIRRQTGIVIGVAIALGAVMAFCVLGGDFDAGPDESAGFAVGILLTAIAQVAILIWAVVLVVLWRVARLPKTGARPGRAIWITLILSPVPLFIFQNSLSSF